MTPQTQRYAIVDNDTVFVCLDYQDLNGSWETVKVFGRYGDTEIPFDKRQNANQNHGGYWFAGEATEAPDALVLRFPERTRTLAYKLNDERIRDMPDTLTPEEFNARWDEDSRDYDPVVAKVYEPVTERYSPDAKVIDDIQRLDGVPWPESGLTWTANLPSALSYQTAYLHLFPGYIQGFTDFLKKHLEARPDVAYCFDKSGHFDMTIRCGQVTRKLDLRAPYRIEGATFAEALSRWDAEVKKAEAAVEALSQNLCPCCNGSGTKVPAPVEPKTRRRRR